MKYEYSKKVDKVIYGKKTKHFEESDWWMLAVASLDQGGFSLDTQIEVWQVLKTASIKG